jgi:hypothetical protein
MKLGAGEISGAVALLTNLREPPLAPARLTLGEDAVHDRPALGHCGFLWLRECISGHDKYHCH